MSSAICNSYNCFISFLSNPKKVATNNISGFVKEGKTQQANEHYQTLLKLESNLVASAVDDLRILVNNNIKDGLTELAKDLMSCYNAKYINYDNLTANKLKKVFEKKYNKWGNYY